MADDWEADDWESENFKPVLPASTSKPDQPKDVSGLAAGLDMSKFADEDADLEEEEDKHFVPTSQPKKKEEKKYLKEVGPVDLPLDDPVAEKLRRQRLEEQADYAAAKDLFGEENQVNLDLFLPKTLKEFEDFAVAMANKYVVPHKDSKNFKGFLKALVKAACGPLPSTEVKDIETSLAGLRADKFKAEKAEADAKKGTRKHLNMGAKGKGGDSAGLDDYKYDDAGNGDDFDFM